jgi:hypothetical protein
MPKISTSGVPESKVPPVASIILDKDIGSMKVTSEKT